MTGYYLVKAGQFHREEHFLCAAVHGVFPVAKANIPLIKAASVIGANYGHFLATQTARARDQVERRRTRPRPGRDWQLAQCDASLENRLTRCWHVCYEDFDTIAAAPIALNLPGTFSECGM